MKQLCLFFATAILLADAAFAQDNGAGRAIVSMEGATHELDPVNAADSTVTIDEKGILFYLTATDQPVSVNFNLFDKDVLAEGSAVFELPEDNNPHTRVELTFFNLTREGGNLQRRIIFSEGTIKLQKVDEKTLTLDFEGAGHPMLDMRTFPMEGAINVELP